MKKNILKLIPLINLILLSSCNNITYKDDNPLFIMGENIKADDSVKQEFLEKTKNYHNYLPDGKYSVKYSCDMFYKGEKFHFYDIEGCIEYSSCEPYSYAVIFNLDFRISKFKIKKVYSNNDIFDSIFGNRDYRYIENSLVYDGNTFAEEEIFKYSPAKREYFTNTSETYLTSFTLVEFAMYFIYPNDFDLYYSKNIYHFNHDFPKEETFLGSGYLENLGFKFSDDFTKLYELSYSLINYKKPTYLDIMKLGFGSSIYKGTIKAIDDLDLELPDLSSYTLNEDNSKAYPNI